MFCPECGAKQPEEDARFCLSCGAPLDREKRTRLADETPSEVPAPVASAAPAPAPATATASQAATPPEAPPKSPRPKWFVPAIAGCAVAAVALVVALVLSLAGKGPGEGSGSAVASAQDGTWTVLVYLCGSNLETDRGYATGNLEELLELDLPETARIVVETGGSTSWHNEVVDPDYLQRFLVNEGELQLMDQQPRAPMGEADTFTDFLKWGTASYPAEHYMLVFWDHGGGSLTGVCQDEMNDDGLTLPEIDASLQAAGVHFDVVGFDTCLMATIETAQMLARHADYMVASEEIIPGPGWAYAEWPAWFQTTSDPDDVRDLCVALVDTYRDKCASNGVENTSTLSAVDLGKIGLVSDAFSGAADAMARSTERAGDLQRLVVEGAKAKPFGYADFLSGYSNMVDLGDLVNCMSDRLASEAQAVSSALDEAVFYEWHGDACEGATGLSVFYPLAVDKDAYEAYRYVCSELGLSNDSYVQYLAVRTGVYDASDWQDAGIADLDPVDATDAAGAFQYAGQIQSNGAFTVRITGNTEFVKIATYQFGQVQPDGSVVPLGSGNMLGLEIDEHGQITYTDQFQGGVLNVGGAYAFTEIVDMKYGDDAPLYNLFSVPVEVTTKNYLGDTVTLQTNLLIQYKYESNSYEVLCYYESADESGMASKTAVRPSEGDQIKFLVSREKDGEIQTGNMGTITWSDDVKVEELFPGDASYVYQIQITDIFGQTYEPTSALITFKDGKRTAELL